MVLTFEQAAHCTLSTIVSKFAPKKAGENLGKIITQKSCFHKKICSPERIRDQIAQTVRNIWGHNLMCPWQLQKRSACGYLLICLFLKLRYQKVPFWASDSTTFSHIAVETGVAEGLHLTCQHPREGGCPPRYRNSSPNRALPCHNTIAIKLSTWFTYSMGITNNMLISQ